MALIAHDNITIATKSGRARIVDYNGSLALQYAYDDNENHYWMLTFENGALNYIVSDNDYRSETISGHFYEPQRLVVNNQKNLGFAELIKNSTPEQDFNTMLINYHSDGSYEYLALSSAGLTISKLSNTGQVLSTKQVAEF